MRDVARQTVREYVERHSGAELLDQVLEEELPPCAEAVERVGSGVGADAHPAAGWVRG